MGLPLPTSKSLGFIALGLLGLPWGYLCQRVDHWTSLLWGYLCQRTDNWISLLWGCSGNLPATLANEQILGLQRSRATRATLGLPLPTSKSLDFIAPGLLGLPWDYLCQRANHWISLLQGYWGYLGATFANEKIIGFHCSGYWGYLGLPLPTRLFF